MHAHEHVRFMVKIKEKSLNKNSSYMCMHAVVLCWEFLYSILLYKLLLLCIWVRSMEDGQYAAISGYLEHRIYPAVFMKSQKFVLWRSCKNYKMVKTCYITRNRFKMKQIMINLWKEVKQRFFLECHLTAGWHRGRDATIGSL